MPPEQQTRQWIISGKVQGVGFRPFVFQLAQQLSLLGWVRNNVGQVEIRAQGDRKNLDQFHTNLIKSSPTISDPKILSCKKLKKSALDDFQILSSESSNDPDIHIPPDYFTCPSCLAEMQDLEDRRFQYPFINCTQCGPRYTLIENLPYDRANTSMDKFPLCEYCQQEYENPLDRRFHAEPLACPVCGPQLQYKDPDQTINDTQEALKACIDALKRGLIIAVKGVGGYHLMCDATNDISIQELRKYKGRPHKPLAVMFPVQGNDELEVVREIVSPDNDEADLLRSPSRPIVLIRKVTDHKHSNIHTKLSDLIAPGLGEIGVMLTYSPLHHLLLNALNAPLVATSANISGEPVLINSKTVEQRLNHITNHFLHHNRPIVRPADDSVYRKISNKLRPFRLGRGHAPIEIELPFEINEPVIACGSHMKNTVALAWNKRMVISPHIGDLNSLRSMEVFQATIEDLQRLYKINAKSLVCDAHPSYASTRWAKQSKLPFHSVQHHKAHASALVLEYWKESNNEPWLIFTWDGTGYGDDGKIWGSEAFYGKPGNWKHVASFRPFRLPGGEKAGREPWRSAAALCWEENSDWSEIPVDSSFLKQAWKLGINAPETTAMGRLFDAASSLTGIIQHASFEGQGPMMLEQKCGLLYDTEALPNTFNDNGLLQADWAKLVPEMQNTKNSVEDRATYFHSLIAHTLLKQVDMIQTKHSFTKVGLSGGVFQNTKLSEYVIQQLEVKNYTPYLARKLPVNDAGISAGQIVEAAMKINKSKRVK